MAELTSHEEAVEARAGPAGEAGELVAFMCYQCARCPFAHAACEKFQIAEGGDARVLQRALRFVPDGMEQPRHGFLLGRLQGADDHYLVKTRSEPVAPTFTPTMRPISTPLD